MRLTLRRSFVDAASIIQHQKVQALPPYFRPRRSRNLKSPDQHFTNSNPYCQVEVEGKPRTRWQTKALPENLDPEWKEERETLGSHFLALIADFAIGATLKFTVRDKDFGTKDLDTWDILGLGP
eukprot:s5742_g1.t1